jgi:hypothetical protein
VRVLALPTDNVAARAMRRAYVQALADGADEAEAEMAAEVAVARRVVKGWEGVQFDDGEPAPCIPANVERYLREWPGADVAFDDAWWALHRRWAEEKKSSATSPPSTGGARTGGPDGAGGAATAASPAPPTGPGSAATTPSRPTRRRARPSGAPSRGAAARSGGA